MSLICRGTIPGNPVWGPEPGGSRASGSIFSTRGSDSKHCTIRTHPASAPSSPKNKRQKTETDHRRTLSAVLSPQAQCGCSARRAKFDFFELRPVTSSNWGNHSLYNLNNIKISFGCLTNCIVRHTNLAPQARKNRFSALICFFVEAGIYPNRTDVCGGFDSTLLRPEDHFPALSQLGGKFLRPKQLC